jgi:hypothetical protein
MLPACTTTMDLGGTKTACLSFEPITWSQKDTDETVRQVKAHNAVWKALCK